MNEAINIDDLRARARKALPRMIFDFIDGASQDEITMVRNAAAYEQWTLRPDVLVPTSLRDQSVNVFGDHLAMPVFIAPTGGAGLLWPRGELETAKAAADMGTLMSVSAGATQSIEAVGQASTAPKWLQLFIYKDKSLTEDFVRRAREGKYRAICLTIDAPVHGSRERDTRNGFTLNPKLTFSSALDTAMHLGWWMRMARHRKLSLPNFERGGTSGSFVSVASYASSVLSSTVTFDDVRWLRNLWDGPLVVKGVLAPDDARRLVECGVDGIQVSNHGGRQLDGLPSTLEVLPSVVDAVGHKVPVFLDGGIRRGSDVIKAIALGATGCFVGRAHLWGLAAGGREGVCQTLRLLSREIDQVMAYGGWKDLASITPGSIKPYPFKQAELKSRPHTRTAAPSGASSLRAESVYAEE